jgi:peptide/nickel transport system substrate-binding protein
MVALGLLSSACSGNSPSGDGKAAAGPPVRGGNLNVAIPNDPQSLDTEVNPGQVTQQIGDMIYEKPFEVDQNFKAQPMLVDTYTKSPDNMTYTFKLRQGVTFQDGNPLTANDVVASLQRWLKMSATGMQVSADLTSITAPDPGTFVMALKRPRYSLIDELASPGTDIFEASVLKNLPATGFDSKHVIGTGPYKLKSWQVGQQLVLERYDGYKSRTEENLGGEAGAKHAYLDTITYKVVGDENALVNGLETGQYDFTLPSNAQYKPLKSNPNVKVSLGAGGNLNVIIPNHNKGSIFSNPKALDALNLLIDKKAMNAATGGGDDLTAASGALVTDGLPLHSDAGTGPYGQYDPQKAKTELAEAGLKPGQTIRIITTKTYPEFYQWAVLLQDEFSKIGVKVDIQTFDFITMLGQLTKNPAGWDITMLFFNAALTSPSQMPPFTLGGLNGSSSSQIAALMTQYNAATSADQAKQIFDQLQTAAWQSMPVIVLSTSKIYAAYNPKLQGYPNFYRVFWNSWLSK